MGDHDHDFIVGVDSISILKNSDTGIKLLSAIARLTEHKDSQRAALLFHNKNTMILVQTSQVCIALSTNLNSIIT